jgi:ribonuclease HI
MDANLHHRHWNPPGVRKNEPEARELLSFLSRFGFRLSSPRHVPTFYSSKGKGSTIDLIWANFLGSKLVAAAAVSNENFGSDHQAIRIQLTLKRPTPAYHWRLPKWSDLDDKKIDLISAELSVLFSEASGDPDTHAEKLTSFLKQAQERLGRKVQSNKSRAKAWWCRDTLDPVLRTRNRARKWMLLAKSPEACECYRQWNDHFLLLVRSLKQKKWRQLLENPEEGDLYRVLRFSSRSAGGEVLPLKGPDGAIVHDKDRQAELLFKGTSVTNTPIDLSDVNLDLSCRFGSYPPITKAEVTSAIQRVRPRKAPGIDGIANELLKSLSDPLSDNLARLYNELLTSSKFPASWKVAVTAIIRKHGKPDYTNPGAYRPIALLSTMSKLFELILARRLTAWAEQAGVLASGHFGGRKGSGTEDALFAFEHWVKSKWREGKIVAALFLDVKSAYPSVHPDRLIDYLFRLKCPTYLIMIIANFLKDRSTTIRLDDFTSAVFPVKIGLPQGSPLSVILYILYNNSLLKKEFCPTLDSVSIGYVDDVVHLAAADSVEAARELLIEEGQRSLRWGDSHGAIFDQAKAQFLWLSKGKVPEGDFPFGSQSLKPATEVKWLGVWLDRKMLFNKNFRVLEEKAHKTINQLRIFGNTRWGTKEPERLKLIKSVLFPRITYGAALWATAPNKGKVEALARKVDRLAGIFTLGVFRSTSSDFIQARSAAQPFYSEVVKTSFSFFYRKIITVKTSNVVRYFILSSRADSSTRLSDAAKNGLSADLVDAALGMDPECIHLSFDPQARPLRELEYINLRLSKEEALQSVKSIISLNSLDPRALLVFSDGSFHPEKGAAGAAVCPTLNKFSAYSLGKTAVLSNHESETVGILAAVRLAKEIYVESQHRHLLIFVDNQGVIQRTKNPDTPKPGQWLFLQVNAAISALPGGLKVSFVWCPGHRDILGNELADQLAKEALESPSTQTLEAKSNCKKVHRMVVEGLFSKKPAPSFLPIGFCALINQLDSGHCTLKKHLFRICRSFDPLCPNCGAKETVFHLMNFCPKIKNQRVAFRKQLRLMKIRFRSERLDKLLNNRKADIAVATFLEDTNRFADHLHPK